MSFKRKLISAATSAVAVVAFSTFAAAQDTNQTTDNADAQKQEMRQKRGFGGKRGGFGKGMRGGKRGGDRMMMRALGKLNLSDQQKEQIRVIGENYKTSNQPQHEEMRSLWMKKRDGIITADEEARFKTLREQMKASGEQMRNSILAILTAEQKAQLEQMKEEKKKMREERRQKRLNQTTPAAEIN